MMNRFPKVLLTLLLTLLLALSLSGCDLMVATGPEAPIPPGVGQTGDQNTPDTPEEPGNTNTPETPDAPQEPGTDDSSTGSKDRYQTDPVPDGKPKPVEPETSQPDTSHLHHLHLLRHHPQQHGQVRRVQAGAGARRRGDPACRYGDVFPGGECV